MCENHFILYLATRHRICTKVTKLLWLTMYSIIVGGIAPDGVSDQPYTILIYFYFICSFLISDCLY